MSKIIIFVLANLISIGIAQQGDVTYVCKVHTDFLEDHKVAMEPFGAPTGTPDDTCRGLMGRPLFEHNGAGADFSSANDCASYSAKLKETIELVASSGCCGPNKLSTCSATPPPGGGTNCGTQMDGTTSRSIPGIAGCTPCMAGTYAFDVNGQPYCVACRICTGVTVMACTPTMDAVCQSDSPTPDLTNCGNQLDGTSRELLVWVDGKRVGGGECAPCKPGSWSLLATANCEPHTICPHGQHQVVMGTSIVDNECAENGSPQPDPTVDCTKCDDCAPFAYCMDPAKVDLNCHNAPVDCAARCGSCVSAAVDCTKCDDCTSFLYCMDPAKADLNCESAPHDCAARCISCVPAEYQQFIAVAISSLCGHGTILDAATNKCVLSYQNFIDRCRSEPHLSTCGNHKDESAAQCGDTPGTPGSTHGEPGNGGGHLENCDAVLSRKTLTCPVMMGVPDPVRHGSSGTSKSSNDWDMIGEHEIFGECCFGPTCGEKFDGICSGTKQLNKWHRPQMINEESCCSDNCHSIMGNQGLTCDGNTKLRGPDDFHDVSHVSHENIKNECCQRTCHLVMQEKSLTCSENTENRKEDDMHQPSGGSDFGSMSADELRSECCSEVSPQDKCLRDKCSTSWLLEPTLQAEWEALSKTTSFGTDSAWVLEQLETQEEYKNGVTCICRNCRDEFQMVWPAAAGVCSVLIDAASMHDDTQINSPSPSSSSSNNNNAPGAGLDQPPSCSGMTEKNECALGGKYLGCLWVESTSKCVDRTSCSGMTEKMLCILGGKSLGCHWVESTSKCEGSSAGAGAGAGADAGADADAGTDDGTNPDDSSSQLDDGDADAGTDDGTNPDDGDAGTTPDDGDAGAGVGTGDVGSGANPDGGAGVGVGTGDGGSGANPDGGAGVGVGTGDGGSGSGNLAEKCNYSCASCDDFDHKECTNEHDRCCCSLCD